MDLSLESITPYFKKTIGEIGIFKFIDKPFDQSIPSTILDRSYSILFGRISGVNRNMIDFSIIASITIVLYRKGYASESLAREDSAKDAEMIVKSCMKVSNSNTQKRIKNVTLRDIDIKAFLDNDNLVESRITFDVLLKIDPNK